MGGGRHDIYSICARHRNDADRRHSKLGAPLSGEGACGAHFREEYQTSDGEAKRDDDNYSYVSAWQYKGVGTSPELHKEPLVFENVELATRSYK